jgi:hypothetical protein
MRVALPRDSEEHVFGRFEVLTVVLLKIHVFWDVILCCLVNIS